MNSVKNLNKNMGDRKVKIETIKKYQSEMNTIIEMKNRQNQQIN